MCKFVCVSVWVGVYMSYLQCHQKGLRMIFVQLKRITASFDGHCKWAEKEGERK